MNEIRAERIFREEMQNDTSFQEKGGWMGTPRYSQTEAREIWDKGIKLGIKIGLRRAALEGQRIELNKNTTRERHREFLETFYKLAEAYSCAIQYHSEEGMVVIDVKPPQF